MGLLGSLAMLLLSMWLFSSSIVVSLQLSSSTVKKARELDARLQDYAYQAFGSSPNTGDVYDGKVPSDLSGIQVSALRLRSGSLKRKGVEYKEFEFPVEVREDPYVERLVLVYQNLDRRSVAYKYYPLQGHTYLASVLGFLAYDGADLTAKNLPELDMNATKKPISIKFQETLPVHNGAVRKCVFFYLNGTVQYSDVLQDNVCRTSQHGHFSIVVESIALPPSPLSPIPKTPPLPGGPPRQGPTPGGQGGKNNVGKIVGSVVGGFALLVILGLLVLWICKFKRRKKMHRMEKAAEVGESLHMTTVGSTRAPAATGTRTQPSLETEYVP
ncbi:hypothetical protein ACS0TY_015281 [Phlomoides rotata]